MLEDVKDVCHKLNVTINDYISSVVGVSVSKYF